MQLLSNNCACINVPTMHTWQPKQMFSSPCTTMRRAWLVPIQPLKFGQHSLHNTSTPICYHVLLTSHKGHNQTSNHFLSRITQNNRFVSAITFTTMTKISPDKVSAGRLIRNCRGFWTRGFPKSLLVSLFPRLLNFEPSWWPRPS